MALSMLTRKKGLRFLLLAVLATGAYVVLFPNWWKGALFVFFLGGHDRALGFWMFFVRITPSNRFGRLMV